MLSAVEVHVATRSRPVASLMDFTLDITDLAASAYGTLRVRMSCWVPALTPLLVLVQASLTFG
jgi:hypothetical protein